MKVTLTANQTVYYRRDLDMTEKELEDLKKELEEDKTIQYYLRTGDIIDTEDIEDEKICIDGENLTYNFIGEREKSTTKEVVEKVLEAYAGGIIADFTYWTVSDVLAVLSDRSYKDKLTKDTIQRIMNKAEQFPSSSEDLIALFNCANEWGTL